MNKKIIDRLNKMMALGKNNGNEGDTAMRMAERLMDEYGITVEQLEESRMEDEFGDMGITAMKAKSTRPKPWENSLADTIARHFGCIYVLEKRCSFDTNFKTRYSVKFVGHESNRITCEVLYEWLHKKFIKEAKTLYKEQGYLRDSYLYGASYTLAKKYNLKSVSTENSNSLMVISAVQRYMNDTMSVREARKRTHKVISDSFKCGQKLGESISLNAQCNVSEKNRLTVRN